MFKKKIQFIIKKIFPFIGIELNRASVMQSLLRIEYQKLLETVKTKTPENPCLYGYKCYSQFDEDGIINYITEILEIKNGIFVEFGCGNGLENNTHLLLLKNWKGIWIDGDKENIEYINTNLPKNNNKLVLDNSFVTTKNIVSIVENGLSTLKALDIDILSMDLDGNDIYLLESLLEKYTPKIIIAEYNGKIPFGVNITVRYNPTAWRDADDFFGVSFSELVERLTNYKVITCGLSGVNAFFVHKDFAHHFPDYQPKEIYQPARTHFTMMQVGSKPSLKFLSEKFDQ